jgi:hypothetical protein
MDDLGSSVICGTSLRRLGVPPLVGHVPMGTWLWETRNAALALTFRPLPPGSYQYIARLERKGDDWKVEIVCVQHNSRPAINTI